MTAQAWQLLACGFGLAEAPLPDGADGSELLVADTLGGGARRLLLADGSDVGQLLPGRRGIGGLAHSAAGGLVVTGRDVGVLTPGAANPRTVLSRAAGVTGYNDLTVTPEGSLLVGALRYRPFAGERAVPGDLVLLRRDEVSTWDSGTLIWPNGLGFSPDGRAIYAADFATGVVHRAVWRAGAPAELKPWVRSPSGQADGLDVDAAGDVWVALGAGGGLARYSPEGVLREILEVPARFVSNCCHAGPDLRTLAVSTADNIDQPDRGGSVFVTRVDVPGLAPVPARL